MARRRNLAVEGISGGAYTATIRAEYANKPGMLGRVASIIGDAGGDIGSIDLVEASREKMVRDITVSGADSEHIRAIIDKIKKLNGVSVRSTSDPVFLAHLGGKIEISNRIPVTTRRDLSTVYTPGVARVSRAIHEDPEIAWTLTTKKNTVAVVTDGSAVLGLGNIGPEAALPVMEGKAMLFKEFAGVDAWPICLGTQEVDEIVLAVKALAPGFGGINLEDISAPRCFEIEQRLSSELNIPVFHDDQHGTSVVVLAALMNALKVVQKSLEDISVCLVGTGAAGTACAEILLSAGVRKIVGVDAYGIVYPGRAEGMSPPLERLAAKLSPDSGPGTIKDAIQGADVFIGVSRPNLVTPEDIRRMNKDPIVFALANPDPEVRPEDIEGIARIIATGRSDYPNQINNVLCFPGLFRGALDVRARAVNSEMKLAAARSIAGCVDANEVSEEYIIPSVFNRNVARMVAREVSQAALASGVARRQRRRQASLI